MIGCSRQSTAHQLVSAPACDEMLKHLSGLRRQGQAPRFLPPETKVAFKTGSLDETKTAAGIIEWPKGPVAVCVLTSDNEDKRWVTDNAGNGCVPKSPARSSTISRMRRPPSQQQQNRAITTDVRVRPRPIT